MIETGERQLAHRVGFGLASHGSVADAVEWAHQARRLGLDSVWIHDSLYERDAVTYASAIASQVPDIRVALGALNPFTRHPVLVAMTISALDDMAPGRIILGLGSGLPLRLGQMGIPYSPELAIEKVSEAIDIARTLWAGERIEAPVPLPPIQPMFPPVHRVPIYIAAYRPAFMEVCGQKADGYLARPAESIVAFRLLVQKIRAASLAAGRPENVVETSGYLLSLVDVTRREALNRAKREPFVIYMISVQSDVAVRRAGFDVDLRTRIAAAWRAEEYHQAANLIPDELIDAFLLCGTREEVASRAWEYHQAGMDMPVLQPIVQEDDQVREVMAAAVDYGTEGRAMPVLTPALVAPGTAAASSLDGRELGWGQRLVRHAGAWYEISRPFSLTASAIPVLTGAALAAMNGFFSWPLFLLAFAGGVLLQIGTNVINEIYDVRKGIDRITTPRASHALLKGRLSEREAFGMAYIAFALSLAIGVALITARGWPIVVLGLLGLIGGAGYTAPPFQYKFHALGLPLVFLLMGPLMVEGAYYVVSGSFDAGTLAASVPIGLLVAAILHGNEWRDISDDARAGIATASILFGRRAAHLGYVGLVLAAYMALAMAVAVRALPSLALLPVLSLPLLVRNIRSSELAAAGQQRAIATIDLQTAQLHATFGFLLALGLAIAAVGPL
ncbi:MAG: LLM class flavin-dependent oxidoreductase [Chloroflexota bacterium]